MVDMGREGLCLSVRLSIQAGETLSWMCGPVPPHWASPALGVQALRGGCRAGLWALGCAAGPPAAACCTSAPQGCLQEGCAVRDGEEEEESCPHKWDEVTRAHHQPRGAAGSRTAFCAEGHAHQLACLHLRHVLWEGTSVLSASLPCRLDTMRFCILTWCQQMLGSWLLPPCHGLSPCTLRSCPMACSMRGLQLPAAPHSLIYLFSQTLATRRTPQLCPSVSPLSHPLD